MPKIKIPAALAGGAATQTVSVDGATVGEAFDNHAAEHGAELKESVVADGELKEFINVFVDGRQVDSLDAELDEDSLIRVMPAASGGGR